MDLSAVYQELCALDAEAFDVDLATAIDDLAGRLHRLEAQQTLTVTGEAAAIRDLLIDDVIQIGHQFGRLGALDDQLLARSIIVELFRPIGAEQPLDLANALGLLASLLSEVERWAEALAYAQECAEVLRPFARVAADDGARLYGRALQDCGAYLARLERWEEAIAVKREALAVFERCLADGPQFRPDVAVTANELFDLLLSTGETAETLQASERAIGIMREMHAEGVPGFLHHLAFIAGTRSSAFLDLDRQPEALESGAEAVDALRALAADYPTEYLDLLALRLQQLSGPLAATGRHDDALAAATEAVAIADELELDDAWVRPLVQRSYGRRLVEHGHLVAAKDAYLAALVNAQVSDYEQLAPELYNLSKLLAEHGWLSEAAEAVTSAVPLYEQLAAANPEWTAWYADALGWLAELQSRCGWDEAALRTAERGVEIAQAVPDRAFLARALGHLGSSLAGAQLHEEAEKASRAALELWQELADQEPERYLNNLAGAWNNLGNRLGVLNRIEEAAAASRRAAELYDPSSPDRVNALNSLAVRLEQLGRRAAARDIAQQATAVYEALVEDSPYFRPQLAMVLRNLAGYHGALGETEQAATASSRAASLLYDLYSTDPEPFQPELLRMLRTSADYLVAIGRLDFAAEAARLRAEVIEAGSNGEHSVELAETLADLGGFLIGLERFDDAAQVLQRAQDMCADMGQPAALHAFVLDKLAWCRFHLGLPEESVRLARRGIQLLEPIQTDDRSPHLPELAVLLDDLCGYLRACNRPLEALEAVSRAVSIRERLIPKQPRRYRKLLTQSLRKLADVLNELGRHRQAQEITQRAEELEEGPPTA